MMADIPVQNIPTYTRKDFMSDQTVRWCPGCGDYAILAAVQKALPELGVRREDIVFISGIGCSSRFPYYMNTYGIHSIHGRAPTLATGLKAVRPELSVWVVTGDGDGLSIGGNHLLHACRRNVDLNILLFNNRIYGLTKGQYSPTSPPGARTKSSPMGTIEQPFNPVAVTLGAEATFIARTMDTHTRHLEATIKAAAAHRGTSFVEIYQNCVIFNDGAWDHVANKEVQDDNALFLEHGQPMIFGKRRDRGIRLRGLTPEVVQLGDGITEADLLVHDQTDRNLAYLLTQMDYPAFPVPFGILYCVEKPTFEALMLGQVRQAQAQRGTPDLRALYQSDYTWVLEDDQPLQTVLADDSDLADTLDEEYQDIIAQHLADDDAAPSEIHESLATDPIRSLTPIEPLVTVRPETRLGQAVRLMQARGVGALVVVDADRRPVGIFTEADVLFKVAVQVEDLDAQPVSAFMTPDPDVLRADMPIAHALHLMAVHHYRHVPIVDAAGAVVGLIAFRDVVRYIETYFDR